MVKLISVKCPECGATLNIESDREQAFCTYCGTKVLLHNENEHIYRHIDEAGVKQAETDRIVMLRKMELLEKRRASAQKVKTLKIGITVILGLVMLICFGIGYSSHGGSGALMVGMVCGLIIMEDKEKGVLLIRDNEIRQQGVGMPTGTQDPDDFQDAPAWLSVNNVYNTAFIGGVETAFSLCPAEWAALPEWNGRCPEPLQFVIGNKKRQFQLEIQQFLSYHSFGGRFLRGMACWTEKGSAVEG